MNDNKKLLVKRLIIAVIVLLLLAMIIFGLIWNQKENNAPVVLQGQMQMQQSAIAAKVPGRIAEIFVSQGDLVTQNQQIIRMDSPEINAKIQQAEAGKAMAQTQLEKALNGARPQEIAQAKAAWQANQAGAALAESTYQRVERLYQEGLMARQKRDEAYTQYIAQKSSANAAQEQYRMATEGARSEDVAAAKAQVDQIDGKLQEAMAAKEEANLKSPINGLVEDVMVNPGEVVAQGVPLLTLVDPNEQWVVLNVTESNLSHFAIGNTFTAEIPALSTATEKYTQTFTVYASSVLADFATWRATNQDDGFDIRTFEIKARPEQADVNIRSGMSVVVTLPKK